MSDPAGNAPNPSTDTAALFQNYIKFLPEIMRVTAGAETPAAQGILQASQAVSPEYAKLLESQLSTYGVPLAQAGGAVNTAQAKAGADTNLALLQGSGGDVARASSSLDKELNPELYGARTSTANQLMNLLGSYNLNGLSGSERAEVERSLNQSNTVTGNLGLDNATNAVSNAMNFGSKLQEKRTNLSNALQTATGAITALQNTSFNPVATALSTAPTTNLGTSMFQPVTNTASNTLPFGQGVLGASSGIYQASIAPRAQASYNNSVLGASNNAISSICCFIMLEAYNGQMPWWVRKCRDKFYNADPSLAVGYRRCASMIVPAMRQSKVARWLTNVFMVRPLTAFGGWLEGVKGYKHGYVFAPVKWFWFGVWKLLAY